MSAGDFPRFLMDDDKLPIGKHPMMRGKFGVRVGTFCRVDHLADGRNLGIIFLGHQPERIPFRQMEAGFFHRRADSPGGDGKSVKIPCFPGKSSLGPSSADW